MKQDSMTLQEYLERIVKLRARAPEVAEQSIIDAAVHGMNLGPCGEYLERRKPKAINKLLRSCKSTASQTAERGGGSRR